VALEGRQRALRVGDIGLDRDRGRLADALLLRGSQLGAAGLAHVDRAEQQHACVVLARFPHEAARRQGPGVQRRRRQQTDQHGNGEPDRAGARDRRGRGGS
jgi:hypothetical protein